MPAYVDPVAAMVHRACNSPHHVRCLEYNRSNVRSLDELKCGRESGRACTDDHRSFLAHLFFEWFDAREQSLALTDILLVENARARLEVLSSVYPRDHEILRASMFAHSDKHSSREESAQNP